MKHESKHRAQEEQQLTPTAAQQSTEREFATTEALLRHDAAQIEVPPAVADRLADSIRQEPPRARSWWQRMFGR